VYQAYPIALLRAPERFEQGLQAYTTIKIINAAA
jgi:hypothetical protein